MSRCSTYSAWLLPLCLLAIAPASAALAGPKAVEFNRDVRPIFSEYCSACHGPDTAKRKAGLRLDSEEGLATVVVAGKPGESELYRRVSVTGKGHMPPVATNKELSPAQIAVIEAWI